MPKRKKFKNNSNFGNNVIKCIKKENIVQNARKIYQASFNMYEGCGKNIQPCPGLQPRLKLSFKVALNTSNILPKLYSMLSGEFKSMLRASTVKAEIHSANVGRILLFLCQGCI